MELFANLKHVYAKDILVLVNLQSSLERECQGCDKEMKVLGLSWNWKTSFETK
jgi:hypothetical protein